jgi:hypothetical protein
MEINNQFIIPSKDASQQAAQGRVGKINKDTEQQSNNPNTSRLEAVVVAPDKHATDNAQAYQQFIREQGNAYSQNAIASYTSFAKQQQRESVETMFGVDIYA